MQRLAPEVALHAKPGKATPDSLPNPTQVMYKSMMIPGWGQVVNKQIWKVPIIYGLLGGLITYSVWVNTKYHDYRAAYYNSVYGDKGDLRFGPTPSYIPDNANEESLKHNRNFYRNRRDFVYITVGLAYGLNVLDAYVFAHLRSFTISDDLSMKPSVHPAMMAGGAPGMKLKIQLGR